ncbi:ATP-binding protein [Paenibacillus sp. J22TS3]|uniref:ATP-binding protein n=1 Tax=Paenibacillus sp. J22TS3 TaxID=2807192 RepID=UPI001B04C819|nr:ATP-binding protein [Paenibacillus sp. J22TS3]GIP21029.1 hypothetical protein J22TS3_13040 [Paenibacillus sp. J22TS3]
MEQKTTESFIWKPYLITVLFIVLMTIGLRATRDFFDQVNAVLLYLVPVLYSAVRWGRGPAFFTAGIGILAFDFFFVPPVFSFTVSDLRYLISFIVFMSVAGLTAGLASKLRSQIVQARQREASTAALYALSRKITAVSDLEALLAEVVPHISEMLKAQAAVLLPSRVEPMSMEVYPMDAQAWAADEAHVSVAAWVYRHNAIAGRGTKSLREASELYVPLHTGRQVHGVLVISVGDIPLAEMPGLILTAEALSDLVAVAISRVKLASEAKVAQLSAESEKLRTAMLDSLSHELRTPLAAVTGSVTSLLEHESLFTPEDRRELLVTIREGAGRMNRLVGNLLGMVRIESGMLRLNKHWCGVEDIVGVALTQLKDSLQQRVVDVRFDPDLPSVPLDEVLMEQVLINVISNAVKYSPENSRILIEAGRSGAMLELKVRDEGKGIPAGELQMVFEKFYRGKATSSIPGTGLGLAICKSIVEAHGGRITARSGTGQGTEIVILLPVHMAEGEDGKI